MDPKPLALTPPRSFPQDGDADDKDLEVAGYNRAMPRRFTIFSMFAQSFDLIATWIGLSTSLGIALTEASSAGVIWGLLVAAFFTMVLSLGMAELASAWPNSGAQYYWAFMVASEEWKPFASYVTGWCAVFGWWLAFPAVSNLIAGMILAVAVIQWPEFEIQNWHQYLVFVGVIWLSVAANTFGSRLVPLFNKFIMILSIAVILATFLTLLICSRGHYAPAAWIFGDTTNSTGWPSSGFTFMLATLNGVFAYAGTDCTAHLAEEIPSPGKNIPKCILWPIAIATAVAWPLGVAMMASLTDIESTLNSPTGFPLIEIFYQSTRSRTAATILMSLFIFCFFGCCVANLATNSRNVWAFSRDNAFPLSSVWSRIHPRFQVPANAMCLTAMFVTLYGLIFLGSANVFASMISALLIFLQTSVAIPQAIVLWRGRQKVLPVRYFTMPEPWGTIVMSVAVAWVAFVDVLACIPVSYPVTLALMNWISVIVVALIAFVLVSWFVWKRRTFRGPAVNWDLMRQRREEALGIGGRQE